MTLSTRQRMKLKVTLHLLGLGVLAGIFYTILADGVKELYPIRNGAIIGFVIALITAYFELNIFTTGFRKSRFITILLVRSAFYFVLVVSVIVVEIGLARMIKEQLTFSELLQNEAFNTYLFEGQLVMSSIYALALILIVNFTRQVSRKLGQGVLLSFITGTYHRPVQENKVFMFLNMPTSTGIIEKMGRLNFHLFINDLIFDITTPILTNEGIIVEYIEDEIVIAWSESTGLKNARAIRCFYDIKDRILDLKEKYIKKYGFIPEFNAAIHCGEVIKGEIGYIKTEIAYHGDVLNATSRILDICRKLNIELLISGKLLKKIVLPAIYTSEKCGDIELKGKKAPMALYTIKEINLKTQSAA